jgi:hypothetical protein
MRSAQRLAVGSARAATPEELATVAVAYVRFALDRPAMFRVMFAEPCDPTNEERVAATAALRQYVRDLVHGVFPYADAEALSTAVRALVHGLAFLHLDGKLDASTPDAVAAQVRAAVHATLTASPAMAAPTDGA